MDAVVVATTGLAAGVVAGFVGAIPPGPVGLSVMDHASDKRFADAVRAGLGGATVDLAICAALGVGAGPIFARLASPRVRIVLCAAYVLVGLAVIVRELRTAHRARVVKPKSPTLSYAGGVARGVLNPTLVANWSLLIAFLMAIGVLVPRLASTLPFAIGAGVGVASWFALLAHIIASRRPRCTDTWLRRATVVAALGVVAAGGAGFVKAFAVG